MKTHNNINSFGTDGCFYFCISKLCESAQFSTQNVLLFNIWWTWSRNEIPLKNFICFHENVRRLIFPDGGLMFRPFGMGTVSWVRDRFLRKKNRVSGEWVKFTCFVSNNLFLKLLSSCQKSVCTFQTLWWVDAVHEGYIHYLSLVRIPLISKPILRPGWHQVSSTCLQCVVYSSTTGPSKLVAPQVLTKRCSSLDFAWINFKGTSVWAS